MQIYNDTDGVPHVHDRPALTISISHANHCALCACIVTPHHAVTPKLGADLEWIEPREDYLVRDYFTASEQARVNASIPIERDTVITAIWSAKEAVLKAIQKGLSIDTHAVEITIPPFAQPPRAWTSFDVAFSPTEFPHSPLQGWWHVQDSFVLTLASDPNSSPRPHPVSLTGAV